MADCHDTSEWPLDLDLGQFPPIQSVIGYGSGVFRQAGYEATKRPMVDVIFVVDEGQVEMWHQENIQRHPEHYAGLARTLGSKAVTRVQRWGPGVYFHPHISLRTSKGDSLQAKYGVVTMSDLLEDLTGWNHLYLAGRMHKPVLLNWHGRDESLRSCFDSAVLANRRAALSAALLLNSSRQLACAASSEDKVDWKQLGSMELFESIVRLSYDGDIRVGVGEDPRKVQNIVAAQYSHLWRIYRPIATSLEVNVDAAPPSATQNARDSISFDIGQPARLKLFAELPSKFQRRVIGLAGSEAAALEQPDLLRQALRGIVRDASIRQTTKGIITAGISRSLRYSLAKLGKRFK